MRPNGLYWVKILRPMVKGSWTIGEFDSDSWFLIGTDESFIDSELEVGDKIACKYTIRNSIGSIITHVMAKDSGEALAMYAAGVGVPSKHLADSGWHAELA